MILACVLLGALLAQATNDEAQLIGLEQTWNEAHLQSDAAALERLWAPDFVVIVPRMQVITRADAVTMARAGRIRFERYETSGVQARVYGESAVVMGRMHRVRKMGDQRVEDNWQFTKVYVRHDGQWKVALFQASEAPD